jgi:hypothetical protein
MCHRRYYRDHAEHRREDPAPTFLGAPAGPVRAGDADRERVAELLRRNAAEGRLDAQELEERLEAVYAATYVGDLDAPVADLPPDPAARRAPARGREFRAGAFAGLPLIVLAVVLLALVTSATGAWMLWWLIWPIAIVLGPRRRYRHGWRV